MTGQSRRLAGRGTTVRVTRQGDAVLAALSETDTFSSAQDLHARLRDRGMPVGLTTIYRHLQVLAEHGEVDVVRTDDGETRYRRCANEAHHHHLVCRGCGRTVEVEGPEIERWTARVAAAEGFTDISHTLELFGTCASCAAKAPTR
ncbi:transcriptional repressor [Frankia sp. AgB1.9]|uniref:Fur family transcriptional regulator n=1 Tax=unclassified Frankia TaxID=2632575 RepID=UPI0019318FA1|nr:MULTISPECIES: Fur family transcriptional regulator [unclassified Frankia]MBL7493696.1 transcriptional repressor [Frankia sp. AgW1.1]MBL7553019.1 transcriptional repressor [Frankia sp. AgB1.9]MBL7621589.1 transcriptional repressor [Frankia sp. AgB1.8]